MFGAIKPESLRLSKRQYLAEFFSWGTKHGTWDDTRGKGIGTIIKRKDIVKQEAQRGPSEAVNTAHVRQYNPRSVASRVVLTDLGRIDGRGRPLKCFLVLLSD